MIALPQWAWMLLLADAVACGALCGWLAGRKRYDVSAWAILGIALGPLALLAMVGAPLSIEVEDDTNDGEADQ